VAATVSIINNMKRILFFILIVSVFASCTTSIRLQVLKPADITLPQDIQKFTLVNRTKPSKNNQAWNIIEGVITGEGVFADREGADNCLSGLMSIMQQTPRYTINQASMEFLGTGTDAFAVPLNWAEVENLCKQNNSEALIVLEAFDSDSRITHDSKPIQVKGPSFKCWDTNKNGKNDSEEDVNKDGKWNSLDCPNGDKPIEGSTITTTEYYAHARMEVKSGWRIYFPKEKRIVDENRFSDFMTFDGKGETPEKATRTLPNKRNCIKRTGYHAGTVYGYRISPQWIYVSRYFYTRGNDNMKIAGKKARQINDWKGAIEIWKKEALNANPKIAWKANYNMALASEREGSLDIALEWAKKAYQINGKPATSSYVNILTSRIYEQQRADEQMKGKQ
jgi:hypothetical protein